MTLFRRDRHLRDEDLLLLQEGELSPRQTARSSRHLNGCKACQARLAALTASSEDLHDFEIDPLRTATPDAARLQLQSRLAQAGTGGTGSSWLRAMRQPRMMLRLASVAVLLALPVAWQQGYRPLQDRMGPYEETGPKPDHALTPGAVRPVALSELCVLPDNDLDPRVAPEKERAVFDAYGMNAKSARAYQVDYLINPQLGGDDEIENLWPEPYHATVWNATAKDALETKLHAMVCSGQVDLPTAQHDLSNDWIAAYKKYFHASRPVSTVAGADDLPLLAH